MDIGLLGAVTVFEDGREWPVQPHRVRTTLAVLALCCGDVVPTEQLIHELWEGRRPGNPRNGLQANVARLRRFLDRVSPGAGAESVRTSPQGYLLTLPTGDVDAKVFEAQASLGMELAAVNPSRAADVLERALRVWRGPALLDVEGGMRCCDEATRLNERRLCVQKKLIEVRMAMGLDPGVVSELKQLAAEHPGDETLSELLMLALYRNGRQSEALAVFQSTRSWLGSELGLEPGLNLRRVQAAILVQDHNLACLPPLQRRG